MRSMTGFGRGSASADGWELGLQVSAVNRRTLEVVFAAPREWQLFEPEVAAAVRARATRGRVQVALEVRGEAVAGLAWDDGTVEAVLDRLAVLAARRGVPFTVTPELLLAVVQASRSERSMLDPEKALALLRPALAAALDDFSAAREREGETLARDFLHRCDRLAGLVERIATRTKAATHHYRERLLTRLRQAGLDLDLDDERVLKEIALFADRIDISEEITRLRSHLEHLRQLVASADPVGRKMDFLLQEIAREIHTIGSKANDLEAARDVIEFKNELERIREQAQNVE